jgi:hypothetical protein
VTVHPGDAFMFASAREANISLNKVATMRSAEPVTMRLTPGWHFLANPYPISLPQTRIRVEPPRSITLYELIFNPTLPKGPGQYRWEISTTLKPFHGYAYEAQGDETFYFDPADTTVGTPVPVAAKASANGMVKGLAAGTRLRVSLDGALGGSRMLLSTVPGEVPISFLPLPGAGLEMRLGGRSGYMIKPVKDLAGIDETVEIRATQAGIAAFALGEDPAAPMPFALIDETNGAVYDAVSAQRLPVAEGSHSYRLLAGESAFVSQKVQAFLAGMPSEIGLSQNYPNPFRGRTTIALDWPVTRAFDRSAVLEVADMQGRRVARLSLDEIRAGRQTLSLDASAWKPGIYVYRLTVIAGGRVSRLQKRMLVAP